MANCVARRLQFAVYYSIQYTQESEPRLVYLRTKFKPGVGVTDGLLPTLIPTSPCFPIRWTNKIPLDIIPGQNPPS